MNFLQRVCREAGEWESAAHGGRPDLPGATVAVVLRFRNAAWLLDVDPDDGTVRIGDPSSVDPGLVFEDGTTRAVQRVRIVFRPNGMIKTAFPILPD